MLYKNLNDEDSKLWDVNDMEAYYVNVKNIGGLSEDIENLEDFINNLIDCGDFELVDDDYINKELINKLIERIKYCESHLLDYEEEIEIGCDEMTGYLTIGAYSKKMCNTRLLGTFHKYDEFNHKDLIKVLNNESVYYVL